ncbi:hypothetical protein ACIQPR_08125 [Streptomyces sp. NPDC091280]|uniref:hypothetical protein n=1 Tax=Streptomyces sp. NPDC091280 TaxID=3365984 RepID=UPI0037FED1B0
MATAVALAWRAWHRRPVDGWWRLPSPGTCGLVAALTGSAVLGAYAWGAMSGFYILDPDQMCAARGAAGDHVVTRLTLPVSSQCVTSGGVGTELVPGWVNPVIFLGLPLLVLSLMTGAYTGVRRLAALR